MKLRDAYPVRIRETGPPVSHADLDACERELGVRFPQAYRDFLAAHNGGVPTPGCFLMKGGSPRIERFHSVASAIASHDLCEATRRTRAEHGLPAEYLPIAAMGDDSVLLLHCGDADAGSLFYWGDRGPGFRLADPDYVNVQRVPFPIADLLRKLGPPWKRREDRDGLFVRLYWAAGNSSQGGKIARQFVAAGYDVNFVLEGYRHPVFAAMDGDAFAVVQTLVELGTREDHRDPSNNQASVGERLREALAWWRNRLDEHSKGDEIHNMSQRRLRAIEAALAVYGGSASIASTGEKD